MRFMIIRKADRDTEAGVMPSEQLLADMMKYNEETGEGRRDAGRRRASSQCEGRAREILERQADRRRRSLHGDQGADRRLHDDPRRLAPGGARAGSKRWPASDAGGNVELELRQVFEAEDFGAEFTPELRATEERLRAEIDQRASGAAKR